MQTRSLRAEQAEVSRLARAFVISLILHLLCVGIYYSGKRLHAWDRIHVPAWLQPPVLTELLQKKKPDSPRVDQEPPLMFVHVSPTQVADTAPQNAQFYSDKNARAANPEAERETTVPKITGQQEKVVRTEDVPEQKFLPLQPTRPATQANEEQVEEKARPSIEPGDLAFAKPDLKPPTETGKAEHTRPRTVKEALARQSNRQLPSQKMRQDGGVRPRLNIASLDTKATAFGAYDAALVDAVESRWHELLYERDYASDSRGRVVLQFQLHADGRISDMNVAENTSGEVLALLCQKAILDPSPYAPWPTDMRRLAGEVRKIQFTFYYN
jgi:hypothetical protein